VVWGQTTHKSLTLILRLNQETRAPHLHVYGADRTRCHPTSRLSGHRVPNMCDHTRSSTAGLLLLPRSSSLHTMLHLPPAHYEISKHDSPNETKIKVKQTNRPRFKFKHHQVNDSSQSNQGTNHLVSHFEVTNPSLINFILSLLYHALGTYFSPYNALSSLHTCNG
jgi:hypothetical protein